MGRERESCNKQEIVWAVSLLLLLLALATFLPRPDDTGAIRKSIVRMGYGEVAEYVTFAETDMNGVFKASIPVEDKATGDMVEYWHVTRLQGATVLSSSTYVEPYPALEEKHHVSFSIGDTRYGKLEQAALAEGKSVEDYLASIPWLA